MSTRMVGNRSGRCFDPSASNGGDRSGNVRTIVADALVAAHPLRFTDKLLFKRITLDPVSLRCLGKRLDKQYLKNWSLHLICLAAFNLPLTLKRMY